MAYANNFPMSYGQYYQQYQYQMPTQMSAPQQNTGITWVQGEAGAKSFFVAPNTTVQLWDSERQTIYLKSADASGMPSIKTLDYTIRPEASTSSVQSVSMTDPINVSRSDLEALQSQIDQIKGELMEVKNGKSNLRINEADESNAVTTTVKK